MHIILCITVTKRNINNSFSFIYLSVNINRQHVFWIFCRRYLLIESKQGQSTPISYERRDQTFTQPFLNIETASIRITPNQMYIFLSFFIISARHSFTSLTFIAYLVTSMYKVSFIRYLAVQLSYISILYLICLLLITIQFVFSLNIFLLNCSDV